MNASAPHNDTIEKRQNNSGLMKPIFVSEPLLPDLKELTSMLEQVWTSKQVTNHGPFHQRLEEQLSAYLGVDTAMLFSNGTIGLIAALKFLDLPKGSEVITTPMTFAATAHAISWNGLKPVFADVEPWKLTIDPLAIERAITSNTSAILGVHVYGTPCDVEAINRLGSKYGLRVIYDAAHVFGATKNGVPIGQYGDVSVFSFHATKLFNTIEGGLVVTPNKDDREKIYYLRNFGIKNEEEVVEIGINGKMNEIQAVIGLLNLGAVSQEKSRRRELRERYCEILLGLDGVYTQPDQPGEETSEQYFPLIIDENIFGRSRDDVYSALKSRNVFSRKYFYPICTDFEPYRNSKIVSVRDKPYVAEVKSRVLCLPFHSGVNEDAIAVISDVFHSGSI